MGVAPGWYPYPSGGQRYWDGSRWLEPPAPSSRWPVWAGVGAVAVFLAVVVVALNVADSRSDEEGGPAPTSPRRAAPTVPGSPIPPSPGEAYQIGGFGNPWLPGVYEAPGGPSCSWVVQRDLVGDASSVLRSGSGPRVGLREGEYFTSEGCGVWQRVGRI